MTGPRIWIDRSLRGPSFVALCMNGCVAHLPYVVAGRATLAAAADAGREHLRQAHPEAVGAAGGNVYQATTYCRTHGVRHDYALTTSRDEAQSRLERDPDTSTGLFGDDFDCCTHDNPLQTAHNQSREGA